MTDGDDIEPDTKNWTWVLERPCLECGFDASTLDPTTVATLLRANAEAWVSLLSDPDPTVRVRPRPDKWSTLEYGCHVRDVCLIFGQRLALMMSQDDPLFDNWDQDATALTDGYDRQDPTVVAEQLAAAAESLALGFEAVSGEQWGRPGRRSDGSSFTVETFARYFIHDPVHHLYDVGVDLI
jgi:hypothetical protein